MEKKKAYTDYMPEYYTPLRKGLDQQRELYKYANIHNDYDGMVHCIENIKSEIRGKAIAKGNSDAIKRIETIIKWYYNLPNQYTVRTEYGNETIYPASINQKISHNLNVAYQILIKQLNILGLI